MTKAVKKKGSTIIEVLIAATLITTAVLASLSLTNNSQKQTDFSRDLNQATFYNNQTIDWLRNMRSLHGWKGFVNEMQIDMGGPTGTLTYCLPTLPTTTVGFTALGSGTCDISDNNDKIGGTNYFREITFFIDTNPAQSVRATISTYWSDKSHMATAETTLAEW